MKGKRIIILVAAVAAIAAPSALADSGTKVTIPSWLSQLQQPGGTSDLAQFENFRGGPAAGGPVLPSDYLGHELGGPGAAGPAIRIESGQPAADGFDWADAGVGAGFAAGIALLLAAGLLTFRSRRTLAHV